MDHHTELTDRLTTLETKMGEVQVTISEAKGYIKGGVLFMGILNTLLLPIAVWQLSTTVATKETNAVQDARLQTLEKVCDDRKAGKAETPSLVAVVPEGPKKPTEDKIRPATSPVAWRSENEQ